MVTTRADATAAPVTETIGGRKLRLSPPNDVDYGEFERWVQKEHIDVTKRNIAELSEGQATELLATAMSEASLMDLTSPRALKRMATVDGASMILWFMARQNQEITFEECRALLMNPESIERAMDIHDSLTRGTAPRRSAKKKQPKPKPRTGAKKATRKARKK